MFWAIAISIIAGYAAGAATFIPLWIRVKKAETMLHARLTEMEGTWAKTLFDLLGKK